MSMEITKEIVFTLEFNDAEKARRFLDDAENRFWREGNMSQKNPLVITAAFEHEDDAEAFREFASELK